VIPLADHFLTAAEVDWTVELPDTVRILDWSPRGRLLAVAANGSALVENPDRVTAPMTPDPRDAMWLGERALVIVDPLAGLVTAGFDSEQPLPFRGARRVGTHAGRTVVAGNGRIGVFGHPALDRTPEVIWTGIGVTHACSHVSGNLWALGGTGGLALVDTALGCVDTRLELPGVVAVASRAAAGRLVVSDLAGIIHVLELHDLGNGIELTGYCDPVRHLALSADGRTVVAAADDELTTWAIASNGDVADEPTCVVAHDAAITALESSECGFLATGDAHGVVQIWSPLLTEYPVSTLRLDSEITAIAWNASGRRLACGAVSGQLLVADITAGALA